MSLPSRQKLGDLLLERKLLTQEQLKHALSVEKKKHQPLARVVVDLGLVDEIVSDGLRDAAIAYTRRLLAEEAPVRRASELDVDAVEDSLFDDYRAQFSKRARGQIAPLKMLEAVQAATTMSFADGQARERELFVELMDGEQSVALRHVFFAERLASRISGFPRDVENRPFERVGIIGGGTMGGGIAMSFANAGFQVTLLEINDEALERGMSIVDKN